MKIITLSLGELERFSCEEAWALISIGTPGNPLPNIHSRNQAAMLRLEFHDWDDGKDNDEMEFRNWVEDPIIPFDAKMARKAWDFIYALLFNYKIDTFVIQCESGMNRSVGMACGVSKCLKGNFQGITKGKLPNKRVYKKMVAVFKADEDYKNEDRVPKVPPPEESTAVG